MMIMKTFPNKLPSKIKQYSQSSIIHSAFESTKMRVEFCRPSARWLRMAEIVEFDVSNMVWGFPFQKGYLAVDANALEAQLLMH